MKLICSVTALAAIGLASAQTAPQAPANCPTNRVRKAWRDLSCEERTAYLDAVQDLKDDGRYDTLVAVHYENNPTAHGSDEFLPWHRWFIWQYETLLQEVSNSCVTLPYWDWEFDTTDDFDFNVNASPLFRPEAFGELGTSFPTPTCVANGVAAGWVPHHQLPNQPTCLARTSGNVDTDFTTPFNLLVRMYNNADFTAFRPQLEGAPHAAPHNWILGQMATHNSPDDPLFWLHHTNVDRMWAIWQDFNQHDQVSNAAAGDSQYTAATIDRPMTFNVPAGEELIDWTLPSTGSMPLPRDMHQSFGGVVSATYANDLFARYLADTLQELNPDYNNNLRQYYESNNPNWVQLATGPANTNGDCNNVPSSATDPPTPAVETQSPTTETPTTEPPTTEPPTTEPPTTETPTTEPPTTEPPTAPSCVDLTFADGTAWFDIDGARYNCAWYAGSNNCATYGSDFRNEHVANEACCACGGGTGGSGRRLLSKKEKKDKKDKKIHSKLGYNKHELKERTKTLKKKYPKVKPEELLRIVANDECDFRGNPTSASAEWIQMNGMQDNLDAYGCSL